MKKTLNSALKILITGGSGQVGFELQRSLMLHGTLLAPGRHELDLVDQQAVASYLQQQQPDLIVNAAAYTVVDKAETEQSLARRLNTELPEQLAHWCQQQGKGLIHYSSDYVYPGSGDQPWQETSATAPLNCYGKTKLAGDQAIIASGCNYLIFRTSWVYSARGNNFMKTMLKLGQQRESLNIVNDQIGAPTPARLIAMTSALSIPVGPLPVAARSADELFAIPTGLYHLAPNGHTTWQGFAQAIFQTAESEGMQLAIKANQVAGIATVDYPTAAQRPLNSRLELTKLQTALGCTLPGWQQLLELTLKEYTP